MIKFKQYFNENKDLDQQLMIASRKGNIDLVKQLIDQGADVHAGIDEALRLASYKGHLEIIKYLVSKGVDIHANKDQALRSAGYYGHLEVVKYLVSKGANIHAINDRVLINASKKGHLDIVKHLIQHGANITEKIDIPEDVQEIAINNNFMNAINIKNLRSDLKEKYKHLLKADKFGFFSDD